MRVIDPRGHSGKFAVILSLSFRKIDRVIKAVFSKSAGKSQAMKILKCLLRRKRQRKRARIWRHNDGFRKIALVAKRRLSECLISVILLRILPGRGGFAHSPRNIVSIRKRSMSCNSALGGSTPKT